MAKTGWTCRTGPGAASVLLLLILFLQRCGGEGGSQADAGGVDRGPSIEQAPGRAETAAAREPGPVTEEGFDRMVVNTAEIGVRVEDIRRSAEEARRIAGGFGGEALSSIAVVSAVPHDAEQSGEWVRIK